MKQKIFIYIFLLSGISVACSAMDDNRGQGLARALAGAMLFDEVVLMIPGEPLWHWPIIGPNEFAQREDERIAQLHLQPVPDRREWHERRHRRRRIVPIGLDQDGDVVMED